jgi:hypothetical protein
MKSTLTKELERLMAEMAHLQPESPEYKARLESYIKLSKEAHESDRLMLENSQNSYENEHKREQEEIDRMIEASKLGWFGIPKETLFKGAIQVGSMALLAVFESSHVWRTSAIKWIPKIR